MATALACGCKRLEAIRDVAEQLMGRPQLGRDVFGRGAPEPIADIKHPQWTATLYDLLSAYAAQRQKNALAHVRVAAAQRVVARRSARGARAAGRRRDRLERLDEYLIAYLVEPSQRATVLASSFAAALEMVREGLRRGAAARGVRADLPAQARASDAVTNNAGGAGGAGCAANEG